MHTIEMTLSKHEKGLIASPEKSQTAAMITGLYIGIYNLSKLEPMGHIHSHPCFCK